MKGSNIFSLSMFSMVLSMASARANCPNVTGTYESLLPQNYSVRTLTIQQAGCSSVTRGLKQGSNDAGWTETINSDGTAYEAPGVPATEKSHFYQRAFYSGSALVWRTVHRRPEAPCNEVTDQVQENCSVTEVVYSLADSGGFTEVQNGYAYYGGVHRPIVIPYKRIK